MLFLLVLGALASDSLAATYYGRLNVVPNITEAGGLFAADGKDAAAPSTFDGYTFDAPYILNVGTYTWAWDKSLTMNYTVHAIARDGYSFKGWATDIDGTNILGTANAYTSSYVSTSTSQSSPTEHTIYAIFEKATVQISESAVPEAGKSYYLLNLGTSKFLKATGSEAGLADNKSQATVFTFSGDASTTLSYTDNGESYYLNQSKGNFASTTNAGQACNWTVVSVATGGYLLWNKNGDNYNRYLMVNNNNGLSFARQGISEPYRTWILVDADKLVDVKMSIGEAKYATFIAPFDVMIPIGVSAFVVDGVTSLGIVRTTQIADVIPANTPVVLSSESPVQKTFSGLNTATSESYTTGILTGVYSQTPAPVGSHVLQKQGEAVGFFEVVSTIPTVAPNRCYISPENSVRGK